MPGAFALTALFVGAQIAVARSAAVRPHWELYGLLGWAITAGAAVVMTVGCIAVGLFAAAWHLPVPKPAAAGLIEGLIVAVCGTAQRSVLKRIVVRRAAR
jgi:hypothetical protein